MADVHVSLTIDKKATTGHVGSDSLRWLTDFLEAYMISDEAAGAAEPGTAPGHRAPEANDVLRVLHAAGF